MDKIDLATGVPNQQFTATLGGNRYEIRIVSADGVMAYDLYINEQGSLVTVKPPRHRAFRFLAHKFWQQPRGGPSSWLSLHRRHGRALWSKDRPA